MWELIAGVILGIVINHLFIKPMERRKYRKMCIEEGLVKEGAEE